MALLLFTSSSNKQTNNFKTVEITVVTRSKLFIEREERGKRRKENEERRGERKEDRGEIREEIRERRKREGRRKGRGVRNPTLSIFKC